jgi:hypothetical protein
VKFVFLYRKHFPTFTLDLYKNFIKPLKQMMKSFFPVALAAIFAVTATVQAQTQKPFFLAQKGAEAEYTNKDAKGEVTSYTKSVVTGLSSADATNCTITFSAEVFDKNHKSMMAPVSSTITVKDGATSIVPVMEGIEIEGTLPSYPINLSVGQTLEYSFSTKTMGMKATTSGKNTVLAKENVTTPAGTFDCYKIEGEVSTKAMMSTTKFKTVSWIAAGVGTVKSETSDANGKLLSKQELVSLK